MKYLAMKSFHLVLIVVFFIAACNNQQTENKNTTNSEAADLVYTNAKIYTVNESNPWVEAVAIKGDKFINVGSAKAMESNIGKNTTVVDLEGNFVMPGLYDLHTHVDLLLEPKYTNGIQTEPLGPTELKTRIQDFAQTYPGDGWIFGGTWTSDAFDAENVVPGTAYLDAFIPDRPVAILDVSRHMLMVNSMALQLAGIDENTFVPEHGEIPLNQEGALQGILIDGAQSLASHVLPQADVQGMEKIYAEGQQILNSYGIVGTRSQHTNTTRLKAVQNIGAKGLANCAVRHGHELEE